MKEYTITMSFSIEAEDSDYEQITEFAEELSENIMTDDKLIYKNDIEIVGVAIQEIQDHSYGDDEDNMYLDPDDDE